MSKREAHPDRQTMFDGLAWLFGWTLICSLLRHDELLDPNDGKSLRRHVLKEGRLSAGRTGREKPVKVKT